MSVIEWRRATVAGVPLRRFTGHVGDIEVGFIEYDGSNRLWTWASPFAEDVWGHTPNHEGRSRRSRRGCGAGLKGSGPCSMRPTRTPGEIGCRAISFTYAATARMCRTSPGQTSAILIKPGRLREPLRVI